MEGKKSGEGSRVAETLCRSLQKTESSQAVNNLPAPYDELGENLPAEKPKDPSLLGFPPILPIELALGDADARTICEGYNISRERFCELCELPVFQKAYVDALESLQKEGMSFKVKARMQAEGLLETAWNLIHNEHTASNVKADLIKAMWRVAGFEPKSTDAPVQNPIAIQINLGDK
jgi:hypothetical protein